MVAIFQLNQRLREYSIITLSVLKLLPDCPSHYCRYEDTAGIFTPIIADCLVHPITQNDVTSLNHILMQIMIMLTINVVHI